MCGGISFNRSKDENENADFFAHRFRCRAPIASLDCMEELNGGTGTDSSNQCDSTPGAREKHTLASCIAASQAHRLQQTSPGIRYRNLGKSGLRVSNVGLGEFSLITFLSFSLSLFFP